MSSRTTAPTTELADDAVARVVWLGERECHEPALAGGKAASLSRLAARFPIPPGFAVTTSASDLACAGFPSNADEISVPSSLADEIAAAYRLLSRRCETAAVAVAKGH